MLPRKPAAKKEAERGIVHDAADPVDLSRDAIVILGFHSKEQLPELGCNARQRKNRQIENKRSLKRGGLHQRQHRGDACGKNEPPSGTAGSGTTRGENLYMRR